MSLFSNLNDSSFTVLDAFSGAGGFSLGFQLAGFRIIGGIEQDTWAAETFSLNHKESVVLVGNIEDYTDDDLIAAFGPHAPKVIVGGPPCQGYSVCRRKTAGDPADPRNSLFAEFIRLGRLFSPHLMIMENVPNLTTARTKEGQNVIRIIAGELRKLGYSVYCNVLQAVEYGVPQIRRRLFVIASKHTLSAPFPNPTHALAYSPADLFNPSLKPTPTLWEAISDLPALEAGQGAECMEYLSSPKNPYQSELRRGCDQVHNHVAMRHSKRMVERFAVMKWGESVRDVPDRLKPFARNSNGVVSGRAYDQNNRRMHPDRPCHTIPASFYANFVHPFANRNFTPREGARLQSFPDWYIFKGKPTVVSHKLLAREERFSEKHLCQYSQIGNAVPPFLAKAIASNLKAQMEGKENHPSKYRDDNSRKFCTEIRPKYEKWKAANLKLRGPFPKTADDDMATVIKRVKLLADYKDFVDQQKYAECFDSRSNLHSSVLEEFIYYLFKDLVAEFGAKTSVGKASTFKDMFFTPPSFKEMVMRPFARIETKDHDFVIGVNVHQVLQCDGSDQSETAVLQIPAVAIECKTYLDKTMLEGSSTAAEQLKMKSPNAIYLVVSEWLKLTDDINLKKFKVDQIYVIRRQKNTDREFRYLPGYEKKPISAETVFHMYQLVRSHLTEPWAGAVSDRLERGYLL